MDHRLKAVVSLVLAALCGLTACTTLQSWLGPRDRGAYPPEPPRPDASLARLDEDAGVASPPVWLEGPLLRAAQVAVTDLASRAGMPDSADPLDRCLSRPEAYDVQVIAEDGSRWIIYVGARPQRCYDGGQRVLDAEGTYEISKLDFSILSAEIGG